LRQQQHGQNATRSEPHRNWEVKQHLQCSTRGWSGYGSIPIDTFLVGWTSIYQLFWGSLGTRVLTHPQVAKTGVEATRDLTFAKSMSWPVYLPESWGLMRRS
jgi:hypothetical protein